MKKIHKLISMVIIIAILFGYMGIISNAADENEINTVNNTTNEIPSSTEENNTSDLPYTNESTNDGISSSTNTQSQRKTTSTTTNKTTTNTKSSNANLSNLGITPHDFTGFSPSTTSYSVTVPEDTESVEVYAQVADNGAKVSGTGKVTLNEGKNVVEVVVTAEDGTTKTYTINITRGEVTEETQDVTSGEGLSKLSIQHIKEMTPEFQTNVYEYTVKYIGENTSLPIEVEPTDESYQVEIVGNQDLKEGENLITILVSTSGGENVATYQITVNKSLVDEEALAKEQAEKEQRQRTIIGVVVAVVVVLAIIIFIILRRRRNRKFAEEYSGVPFYGVNDTEDDFEEKLEEQPRALKRKKRFIEEDELDNDENEYMDKEEIEQKDIMKMLEEDEEEKKRRQRVREKFLNGYNRNKVDDDQNDEQYDDFYEDYEESRKTRSKGKRFK